MKRFKIYFDYFNNDSVSQAPYGLLNFTASIETIDERWKFSMFVRNTRDQLYLTHAHVIDGAPQQLTGSVGAPKTYGLRATYHF